MVWFGKHSVAYVTYVPAALAGLLLPYAWAFTGEAAAQQAAHALSGLTGTLSFQSPATNGRTNGRMANFSLEAFVAARLEHRRLSAALLGGRSGFGVLPGRLARNVLTTLLLRRPFCDAAHCLLHALRTFREVLLGVALDRPIRSLQGGRWPVAFLAAPPRWALACPPAACLPSGRGWPLLPHGW